MLQMMDVIDCLPPGLHEIVISPRPADVPRGGFVTGDWIARFEPRSLDDIRALGATFPRTTVPSPLPPLNLSIYSLMQPFVRALALQLAQAVETRLDSATRSSPTATPG